jgi:hypothetical protein
MNSRQNEDERVQRLLSLLDRATEPEASDHVDDDSLALLAGGRASAQQLAAVRVHLVACPRCRRLVGEILSDAERSRPEVLPARTWGWPRRATAILARAVAACLLLGMTVVIWSLNRGGGAPRPAPQPSPQSGPGNAPLLAELLAAPVSWERSGPRGIEPERSTITLKIESPQSGIAVVLMVANGHWELLRGERPMIKGPGNEYGPIEPLPAPVAYIVVLSDRQGRGELSGTIRESLPKEPRDIEAHYETWRDDVRARLTRGGHRWVSIEPMRVVPTKSDSAERPAPPSQPGRPPS